jgi:hypothetical protein
MEHPDPGPVLDAGPRGRRIVLPVLRRRRRRLRHFTGWCGVEPVPGGGLDLFAGSGLAERPRQPTSWRRVDGIDVGLRRNGIRTDGLRCGPRPRWSTWNRVSVSAFGPLSPNPLVSMATDGANWLAAARPIDDASPSPSLETGQEGLWLSTNAGASWQAVDTFIEPWRKADRSELYLVAFATGTPVIAGVVDGRLAVWTGV